MGTKSRRTPAPRVPNKSRRAPPMSDQNDPYEPLSPQGGAGAASVTAGGTNSVFASYVLVVNFVFGAGVLGIPYALSHAGIVMSAVMLTLMSILSGVSMIWIVEACARAESI